MSIIFPRKTQLTAKLIQTLNNYFSRRNKGSDEMHGYSNIMHGSIVYSYLGTKDSGEIN